MGIGIAYRIQGFVVEGRGAYRLATNEDLIPAAKARTRRRSTPTTSPRTSAGSSELRAVVGPGNATVSSDAADSPFQRWTPGRRWKGGSDLFHDVGLIRR